LKFQIGDLFAIRRCTVGALFYQNLTLLKIYSGVTFFQTRYSVDGKINSNGFTWPNRFEWVYVLESGDNL